MTTSPSEATDKNYDNADFYDCQDNAEQLCHETVEEAIADMLGSWMEPDCDVLQIIRDQSPVTVTAYAKQSIQDIDFERVCERAAEQIVEDLDEEYADPDGDNSDVAAKLGAAMLPIVRDWLINNYEVWTCRQVGDREYTAEEVEAMMREHEPTWFEQEKTDDTGGAGG